MQTKLSDEIAQGYKSQSQKIRVMTEAWIVSNLYCPNCGKFPVQKYPNNQPVADFVCGQCKEDYELKSKKGNFSKKLVDGAYQTMVERLSGANNPNFIMLSYGRDYSISNLCVVPKHFVLPDLIEKRKPLSASAKRAGWIGCNILLNKIPDAGKIYFVRNGLAVPDIDVRNTWKRTLFLRDVSAESKGWLLDIMGCIEKLGKKAFSLAEIYAFEFELGLKHPENKHVRDKLRQQLQVLRDAGYLDFESRGMYKLRKDVE